MLVGHYAVGLALKKVAPRLNLGWTFLAVMLLDALLGLFVLLGIEKALIPTNYHELHYLTFEFPFSHGLTATLFWASATFLIVKFLWRGNFSTTAAIVMSVAVFSHFLLDVIVHIPEMPLAGENSYKVGFGLWNNLHLALGLEVFVTLVGLTLYLNTRPMMRRRSKIGVPILIGVLILMTVGGQAFAPAPTDVTGPAFSWIGTTLLIALIAYWLDKDIKS
ncbi:MAG: hypothetical protein GXP16_17520 [Gammaproteobacteria bacterium]|nr:hypothetical protein [Gammaproteobacteria bacterium]